MTEAQYKAKIATLEAEIAQYKKIIAQYQKDKTELLVEIAEMIGGGK